MGTSRAAIRVRGSADTIWWATAIALTIFCIWAQKYFPSTDESTPLIMSIGLFFLAGTAMGFACSERPWRWVVAMLACLIANDVLILLGNPRHGDITFERLLTLVLDDVNAYASRTAPAAFGAYLGSYLGGRA